MKIWFIEFPTYQYKEDVKALAKANSLKIIDAKFDDGKGEKDTPRITKKTKAALKKEEIKKPSILDAIR